MSGNSCDHPEARAEDLRSGQGVRAHGIRCSLGLVGLSVLIYPLGVLCHELIGHGGVGILCGGRIAQLEILCIRWWPHLEWIGWNGHYGSCRVVGVESEWCRHLFALGGSMSTFLVSIATIVIARLRRSSRELQAVLLCLAFWWIDLLTYTLPSWGLRRSVFWGQTDYSEPLEAAAGLGIPTSVFQTFVLVSCAALAVISTTTAIRFVRSSQQNVTPH